MQRVFFTVILALLAAAAFACSDGGSSPAPTSAPETPSPTETPQVPTPAPQDPTPTPPPGGATGIAPVDAFLEVREAGDAARLSALVRRSEVPCKLPSEADYWVHCPAGAASGTPVEAFPWWGCHGPFSNGGTDTQIGEFFSTFAGELYSVLRFTPEGELGVFDDAATLAVVFDRPADGFGWAAVLDDAGGFYGVVTGCPLDADELVDFRFAGATVLFER